VNNQNPNPRDQRRFAVIAGLGCGSLTLLFVGAVLFLFFFFPLQTQIVAQEVDLGPTFTPVPGAEATQIVIPTLTVPATSTENEPAQQTLPAQIGSASLADLYNQINPGVVNIQVYVERQGLSGQGSGSGFILDDQGHIVTNNHVVAGAEQITIIFYNDFEVKAELIGSDTNSDLAVMKVDDLPEGVHPLVLGDSDLVTVGEWVIAIGNPFGQQSSMSAGIVS
jgi:S1-C subfamily serine protease